MFNRNKKKTKTSFYSNCKRLIIIGFCVRLDFDKLTLTSPKRDSTTGTKGAGTCVTGIFIIHNASQSMFIKGSKFVSLEFVSLKYKFIGFAVLIK